MRQIIQMNDLRNKLSGYTRSLRGENGDIIVVHNVIRPDDSFVLIGIDRYGLIDPSVLDLKETFLEYLSERGRRANASRFGRNKK